MKLKWTYDKCKEEALKYSSKIEFKSNCSSAYQVARVNNWLNDICSHMIIIGHKYKRCIYSFEFSNNYVYIGLTYNINKRKNEHFTDKNSQVYKYFQKIKILPKFNQLTDYLDLEIARQEEDNYIQKYLNDGWNILNKNKAGVIGSSKIFYTKEKCQELALNYSKSSDFAKKFGSYLTQIKENSVEKLAILKNNKVEAVMISKEEFEKMSEALKLVEKQQFLSSVENGLEDIKKGKTKPISQLWDELDD